MEKLLGFLALTLTVAISAHATSYSYSPLSPAYRYCRDYYAADSVFVATVLGTEAIPAPPEVAPIMAPHWNRKAFRLKPLEVARGSMPVDLVFLGDPYDPPLEVGKDYVFIGTTNHPAKDGPMYSPELLEDLSPAYFTELRRIENDGDLGVITGAVVANGQGMPTVRVLLEGDGVREELSSGAEGGFHFGGLRPGRYRLSIVDGHQATEARIIQLGRHDCEVAELIEVPAKLSGKVRFVAGEDSHRLQVDAVPIVDGELRRELAIFCWTREDEGNAFEFTALPAGEYVIGVNIVTPPNGDGNPPTYFPGVGSSTNAQRIHLGRGENVSEADFTLARSEEGVQVNFRAYWPGKIYEEQVLFVAENLETPGQYIISDLLHYEDFTGQFSLIPERNYRFYSIVSTTNGKECFADDAFIKFTPQGRAWFYTITLDSPTVCTDALKRLKQS